MTESQTAKETPLMRFTHTHAHAQTTAINPNQCVITEVHYMTTEMHTQLFRNTRTRSFHPVFNQPVIVSVSTVTTVTGSLVQVHCGCSFSKRGHIVRGEDKRDTSTEADGGIPGPLMSPTEHTWIIRSRRWSCKQTKEKRGWLNLF